jgi:hypothetical protein
MRNAEGMLLRPRWLALLCAALVTIATAPLRSADQPHGYLPPAYAIQGAKIVAGTGTTFEVGTVVVRNGLIEAVGEADKVAVPFDAEVIDGKGLVVYPGFIDLFTTLGQPAGVSRSQTGPARSVSASDDVLARTPFDNRNGLTPEFALATVLNLPDSVADDRRRLGFTDLLAAPAGAIATGQSVLVSLKPERSAPPRGDRPFPRGVAHQPATPVRAGRDPADRRRSHPTAPYSDQHGCRRHGPALSTGADGNDCSPAASDDRLGISECAGVGLRREEGTATGPRPHHGDAPRSADQEAPGLVGSEHPR